MTEQESAVVARLNALGIVFTRHDHPPVATVEEAMQHWAAIDATHCKNLFLRNQKGNRHYLVVIAASKKADLRAVADQIGDGKLSFASPERLLAHLGLTPGSVSRSKMKCPATAPTSAPTGPPNRKPAPSSE